jgi:hypothetical protein
MMKFIGRGSDSLNSTVYLSRAFVLLPHHQGRLQDWVDRGRALTGHRHAPRDGGEAGEARE